MTSVAVGIPTAGRVAVLAGTLEHLASTQRVAPAQLLIAPAPDDVLATGRTSGSRTGGDSGDRAGRADWPVLTRLDAPLGLCLQRNALLEATEADLLVMFDDDFLPAADFLSETVALFERRPDVVCATGEVIADGIVHGGLDPDDARRRLASDARARARAANGPSDAVRPTYAAYGCNMVVRMATVREHGLRFDEALPLYAWQEDVDFSRQLARHGAVVVSRALRGVHLGTRSGRTPGLRLGYSQIANPVYLSSKGTVAWWRSLRLMSRNVAANLARSIRPEPWVDRRGRLRGNALAIRELCAGRLHPMRAKRL